MSSYSGFDGLAQAIIELIPSSTSSLYVNEYKIPRQGFISRVSNRLIGKKKLVPKETHPSPYVSVLQQHISKDIVLQLKQDPELSILLTVCENQFTNQLAKLSKDLKSRIIVIIHQPPSWYKLNWLDFQVLNNLKAIVVLSTSQAEYFTQHTNTPLIQIKHGVDYSFFTPPKNFNLRIGENILIVGQWLRNYELLYEVMKIVWQKMPNIRLHCVIPYRSRSDINLLKIARNKNAFFYDSILPQELVNLYQKSDILLMPLIDSTANNAALEALMCALPIVSNKIGGIPEYVKLNKYNQLLADDSAPEEYANAVINLLNNLRNKTDFEDYFNMLSENLKELYSWKNIATNLITQLKNI